MVFSGYQKQTEAITNLKAVRHWPRHAV